MAKKDKDEMAAQEMPQTMEDYLLSQLEEQVVLKDGSTLKGQDGHVMTKQEAIAVNLINNAMKECREGRAVHPEHSTEGSNEKDSSPLYARGRLTQGLRHVSLPLRNFIYL